MPVYRLYCLDRAGKITNPHHIDAINDAEAIILARGMKLQTKSELWLRDKMVAEIGATR